MAIYKRFESLKDEEMQGRQIELEVICNELTDKGKGLLNLATVEGILRLRSGERVIFHGKQERFANAKKRQLQSRNIARLENSVSYGLPVFVRGTVKGSLKNYILELERVEEPNSLALRRFLGRGQR